MKPTLWIGLAVAALILMTTYAATAAPACQAFKNPVQCEVGGACVWTVAKGKKSKCLPLKATPRR